MTANGALRRPSQRGQLRVHKVWARHDAGEGRTVCTEAPVYSQTTITSNVQSVQLDFFFQG